MSAENWESRIKRIFQTMEHVVESNGERLKFAGPADRTHLLMELLRPHPL